MNLYDFAMKMELDGKAYYEKLAAEATITALQALFSMLAADEQKHYETILAMKTGENLQMADSAALKEAKNVFEMIKGEENLFGGMEKELAACKYAMKIEKESVRLYEDMAKKENNSDIVELLLRIANEEKKHYNIIDNLYDAALRPEYFLEWKEFSNLERL